MRNETRSVVLRAPDDFHVHFRQGPLLGAAARCTAQVFARALVMPNTRPPVMTGADAASYRAEILAATRSYPGFAPLLTIQVTAATTPAMVNDAAAHGVIAGKVYPKGQTTNSDNGIDDYRALFPVFAEMQRLGLVLSLHGEAPDPSVFCLDREAAFLATAGELVEAFPDLRIVLEHVSCAASVAFVREAPPTVAATVTPHHLDLTLDDLIGERLHPHLFCKPVAKRDSDREAIRAVVLSGHPRFFFGSDSAPHLRVDKEGASCCAGIFNAPVALAALAEFFDDHGTLQQLEAFVSVFGAAFYGLPRNRGSVSLVDEPWVVPLSMGGVVPYRAGNSLPWSVRGEGLT